jgi:hypothetical protein
MIFHQLIVGHGTTVTERSRQNHREPLDGQSDNFWLLRTASSFGPLLDHTIRLAESCFASSTI